MPFTVTSPFNTLSLGSGYATYHATAHGVGGLLYMKYTKGDEDGITIGLEYATYGLTAADFYKHVSINNSTRIVVPTTYIFTASGNYRLPITWTTEERYLKFTLTQYGVVTSTGTVVIDFREAE